MKVKLGMAPYWRGGVPVERGQYPGVLEWRPQRETTTNPEIFQGWIASMEAVLATAGLSLVTQQTGGGTIIYSAAGHKVAELKKTMSGWEGTVYSRPVGGPGPGAAGRVAAEQIRRSSTWLGYGDMRTSTIVGTFKTPTSLPTAAVIEEEGGGEYHLAPEVASEIRRLEAHVVEMPVFNPDADPHRKAVEEAWASGTKQLVIGSGLGVLGVVGGIVTAFAGKGLGAGAKIAAGVASAGAGVGGSVVGVKGHMKRAEVAAFKKRYDELDDIVGGAGKATADTMSTLSLYDANFYQTTPRPHPAIAAEMQVLSKNYPKTIADNLRATGKITMKVQGLSIEDVPTYLGHPVWAQVGRIEAEGRDITVCSPASCADPISGREVWLHVKDMDERNICRVRVHRYRGTWNWGWFPGLFDKASRQCWGCTKHEGDKAHVIWENGYDNFEGSGAPPAGFYMRASSNSWLDDVVSTQALGSADLPSAGGLESERAKVRGPMGAIMQAFRSLRASSPEVTMMYWPGTWDLVQMCAATAHIHDARAWWMKVGDWIGTLFGVAAFVCEVATPIISCINPAVGAALGAGMTAAIQAGKAVSDVVEGRPGGVLDVIGSLGWTSTDLQSYMRVPLDKARDFSPEVEEMVKGWMDAKGLFAGRIGELAGAASDIITEGYNPAQQYRIMIGEIYDLAASEINRKINLLPAEASPFYVSKMVSFSSLPEALEGTPFPVIDPRAYYMGTGE